MNIFYVLLTAFFLILPALALVDSEKKFPTKAANWTITSHHMDTGDLRGCSAKGKFSDLEVNIGNALGGKPQEISFRFVRGGTSPGPANPGEQKSCGQENLGHWHYSPNNSSEEFCDGKAWIKITEGHFKKARLLLNGSEIATAEEAAHFKLGVISRKPVFFEYSAWFQNVSELEKKLSHPGKTELSIEGQVAGPIAMGDLQLDAAIAELARCGRERK